MEARANEDWGDRSSDCEGCGQPFDAHVLTEDTYGREVYRCPAWDTCPLCGGSGDDPDDPTFTCPRCNGAGEVEE
jgi:hypothetical protein